ncbi:MAG: sigma-54-dependent transcriptional regulator [Thermodesulfobacteriota bacterium]
MVNKLRILIIDDDEVMRDACREILARGGHDVELAAGGGQGLALLSRWAYDVVLLDLRMPDIDGMTVLRQIREQDPQAVVIVITGHGSIHTAVEAMKLGAFDFLPKPFSPDELRGAVEKAQEKRHLLMENAYLKDELRRRIWPTEIVSAAPAMLKVLEMVERVAGTDTTVLLTGESGTGKGLLARRLHEMSPRRDHPFVSVDCSTLVPTLFESEVFGHVKGAFTGAEGNKIGKFELADGGTLFFDEVGNISRDIQAKLLKAVEERAITKVGSHRVVRVDIRLVAATNQDLRQAVSRGDFRQDLFYRLNVLHIHLPALRQRREDVPTLAEHFLRRFRSLGQARLRGFTPQAIETLVRYDWPGNVRELQNMLQRLVVMSRGPWIDVADLEGCGLASAAQPPAAAGDELRLEEVERQHIAKVLHLMGGRRSETAQALGIDRKTLRLKLRKYQMEQ